MILIVMIILYQIKVVNRDLYGMEYQLLLDNFKKFVLLTPEEEQELLSYTTERIFKRGKYITVDGEINRYINFIVKGSCRVFYIDNDGHEHIVQLGNSNWWTGDFTSFITQHPGMMYTETLEQTELLSFSYDNLQKVYERVPKNGTPFSPTYSRGLCIFSKKSIADAEYGCRATLSGFPESLS